MRGLVEQIKETVGAEKESEMMDKFTKGVFTLRDMYEQFQNVMKLGPLSKVMGMIPGIPPGLLGGGAGGDADGGNRLKRFMFGSDAPQDEAGVLTVTLVVVGTEPHAPPDPYVRAPRPPGAPIADPPTDDEVQDGLDDITLHYITLHCIALHYITPRGT